MPVTKSRWWRHFNCRGWRRVGNYACFKFLAVTHSSFSLCNDHHALLPVTQPPTLVGRVIVSSGKWALDSPCRIEDCSVIMLHILTTLLCSKCHVANLRWGGTNIHFVDTSDVYASTKCVWAPPLREVHQYQHSDGIKICYRTVFGSVSDYQYRHIYTCLASLWLLCLNVCVPVGRCIHIQCTRCVFMHYSVCIGHLAVQSINIWDLWNQVCSGESTLSVSWDNLGRPVCDSCLIGIPYLNKIYIRLHASHCSTLRIAFVSFCSMFDVGGQRIERRKWIQCFNGLLNCLIVL